MTTLRFLHYPVQVLMAIVVVLLLTMIGRTMRRLWLVHRRAQIAAMEITRRGDTFVLRIRLEDQEPDALNLAEEAIWRGIRHWLGLALHNMKREVITEGNEQVVWFTAQVEIPDGATIGGDVYE